MKQHILLRLHVRNNTQSSQAHPALLALITFDTPLDATRFGNYVFDYQHKVFGNWNGGTLPKEGLQAQPEVLRLLVKLPHEWGCHTLVRLDPTYQTGEASILLAEALEPYYWADYLENIEQYPGRVRQPTLLPQELADRLYQAKYTYWQPNPLTQEFYEVKGLVIEPDTFRLTLAGRDSLDEFDSDPVPNALLIEAQREELDHAKDPALVLEQLASIEEAFGPKPVTTPEPEKLLLSQEDIDRAKLLALDLDKPRLTRAEAEKIFLEVTAQNAGELRKVTVLVGASPVATPDKPYEIAGVGFVSEAAWNDFDQAMMRYIKQDVSQGKEEHLDKEGWISVEKVDRPEPAKGPGNMVRLVEVDILLGDGHEAIGYWSHNNKSWLDEAGRSVVEGVTHWRPRPE